MSRRVVSTLIFCVLAFGATLVVQAIWSALLVVNLGATPAIPWSVAVMAGLLWVLWRYAGGHWPPVRTQQARAGYLRADPLPRTVFAQALAAGLLGVSVLVLLWTIVFQLVAAPAAARVDLGAYPPLTVLAVLLMASALGAIVEEAGLRGYMLTRLQREVPGPLAVVIVALAIAPGHGATQGFVWPVLIWYLLADMLFGALAYTTRSIRPGIIVHAIGLLVFFAIVWPADATRTVIALDHAGAQFWLTVAACVALAVTSVAALIKLAMATRAERIGDRAQRRRS